MNKILENKKVINIIDVHDDLDYKLDDGDNIVVNFFSHECKSMNINITLNNNSYVVINYSCLVYENADIKINCLVKGNNNKVVIKVRTLGERYHGNFYVNTKVSEKSVNNEIIEDLKGILDEGTICFMPILEIDTNMVNAEHFATIGSIDKDELFYLQMKGISINTATSLLKKKFIYNLFSDNFIKMLNEGKEKNE